MAGYVRVDTSNNISDGNVIAAADLDNEFDGIQAAFNASTGHNHDGTTGEGAPILVLGPTQDVVVGASTVTPKTTNTVDIGSSSLKFKDLFLAGNASIGGTLAVTGVATLTAQPILSSLTASRAVFTDGSKGLVSNAITGTGNVVMSASPTLTGTITAEALTTSSTVTVNGGTANAVAFLNGSKVLTTGSALTFDGTNLTSPSVRVGANLGLSSLFEVYSTSYGNLAAFRSVPGDGINPYLLITSSASGITFEENGSSYGSFMWKTNATEQMRLTSTGLGIGTSSPATKLHVYSTTARPITAGNASSTWTFGPTGESFAFRENSSGSDFLTLSVTGNVGIGTSAPGTYGKLELTGGNAAILSGNNLRLYRGDNLRYGLLYTDADGFKIQQPTNDPVFFTKSDGTVLAQINNVGNLGLGVTPSAWGSGIKVFEFGALGGLAAATFDVNLINNVYYDGSNNRYRTTNAATNFQQVGGAFKWYTAPSGTAGNAISFTQAMTLDASGRWLLGTTTGVGGDFASIRFNSGSSFPQGLNMVDANASANGTVFQVFRRSDDTYLGNVRRNSTDNALYVGGNSYLALGSGDTERARIDSSGNLLIGATSTVNAAKAVFSFNSSNNGVYIIDSTGVSGAQFMRFDSTSGTCGSITRVGTTSAVLYNTTSDYRLKTVIGPVTNSGQRIDALEPVEYEWNSDGSRTRGFLAHKFQEVYAGSVTGSKDAVDAQGNPVYQAMQAGSAEIIADLVAEIQSLRARVAALESN